MWVVNLKNYEILGRVEGEGKNSCCKQRVIVGLCDRNGMYFVYKPGFNTLLILIGSIRISKVSLLIFCVCVIASCCKQRVIVGLCYRNGMYFVYKPGFYTLLILIRSIRISKVSLLIFCVCVLSLVAEKSV